MKKRVLSIIMVFTMLLSVFDQTSLTVAAEEGAVKSIMLDTSSLSAWSAEDGYDYLYFGKDSTTPIKWRILDTKTNTNGTGLFLLSENVFEEVRFSTEGINTYQGSNAQAWCNTFCDGKFSTAEKSAAIATSTADSRLNNDKVFFLSTEEATNLFSGDTTRIATDGASNKLWWLRTDLPPKGSADLSNPKVAFVGITGKVSSSGSSSSDELSARPAFNLNLTPIRFISAAEGGKPVGQLQTVNTYNGNAWKVTLADAARDGFQIQETAASAVPGGTVTISYTGAAEGANEYVSAMIVDSDNACLYYGQIASGSASGTAALTIPAGLTQGNYTIKVFSEQINGDKMTDYASAFCSLSLEVLPSPRYCVCGDADCPGTAEGHEIVDFLPLPATGGELAGSYYLDKDITLTSNIVVAEETTLNLSLNGHVLQGTSDTEATVIKNNGTLRICSYDTTTVHKFVPNAEGLWVRNEGAESDYETVYGGVITGSYGAIHNTGTAVMYHVNLIGSESMSGGGVSNMSGTFTMNGGSISGNKAENYGGVLNMGGTFTMNGGSISGNRATDYAGVANKNGGTFTMNGGSISENQAARNYGAVYSAGTFVIDGSKICDNTAKTYGGVSNASGSFTMKDSEISGNTSASGKACGLEMQGNMSISGKVIIANNTVASAQKNLSFKGAAITKDGALDSASSIGVGFFMPLAEGSPIKIATSGTHTLSSTDMERFFADSAEEHIEFYGEDGCGYLVAGAPPQEMTGVSAEGATKTYDGNEYGIHVSLTGDAAGATVTYGTVEGTYNLTESPKIKNVGTQTVYYKVTKEGYKNVTGSATVTINKKELNNAMFPSISAVTYDGSEKEPTVVLSDMAGSRELIQTSDYSISYSNNTAAGTV